MKSILRLPVVGLARAVFAHSATLRHLLFLLPLALPLPVAAQSRGFFRPATLNAYEPNSLVVTLERAGDPELPAASLELVTADCTADTGEDYTAVKPPVLFTAGQPQQLVTIPLIDDEPVEGPETDTVTLQNQAGGAPLDPAHTAKVTIPDDHRGFNFGVTSTDVSEDGGSAGPAQQKQTGRKAINRISLERSLQEPASNLRLIRDVLENEFPSAEGERRNPPVGGPH